MQFDGTYETDHLPVGRTYEIYAEPLGGAVSLSDVTNALTTLCRNSTTDPGWLSSQACIAPAVDQQFTTRTRPAA